MSTSGGWSITRWIATGVGAIVVLTVLGVAGLRLSGYSPSQANTSPVLASCELRFVDAEKGLVLVYNNADNRLIATLEPAKDSFVRGVMRGMARERRSRDVGMEAPFRLSRHSDGSLILVDEVVGTNINLLAFGPTNVGSFEKLLAASTADS